MRPTRRYGLSDLRAGAVAPLAVALLLAATALWAATPIAASFAARVGAGKAAGQEARSFVSLLICFASGASSPDAQTGLPGPHDDRSHDCSLCQMSCCGDAPLVARPGLVGAAPVQRIAHRWTVADRAAPTPRPRLSHRPRAPPIVAL